jgi:hypothetical protein
MASTLINDGWPVAGFGRRGRGDGDALDAIRGIIIGSVLSMLTFWMPLGVMLTR